MNTKGEYRLAALDMDGTLLNSDHETTDYTRDVIRRAAEAGKTAAISTGRCLSELWEHFEMLPGIRYVICENGACVYDIFEKKIIHHISFSDAQVMKVFDIIKGYDLKPQFFRNNQSVMQCENVEEFKKYHIADFTEVFVNTAVFVKNLEEYYALEKGSIEKFNLYTANEPDKIVIWDTLKQELPELILSDSIGVGIEVSPAGATKAVGLEKLCEHLGIPVEQSMAVGDASNDLEIIRAAGLSVAMGNATEAVREEADVVTEDCDHDGAAKAIQRYMLGENI
ncbi:MAG: HAD family phosphatase [Clostridia bacterium]|nr:HAD family phosphatase [Clostridia bacterium]